MLRVVLLAWIESAANAFQLPDGSHFDFVINCAAETRSDQSEEVLLNFI